MGVLVTAPLASSILLLINCSLKITKICIVSLETNTVSLLPSTCGQTYKQEKVY